MTDGSRHQLNDEPPVKRETTGCTDHDVVTFDCEYCEAVVRTATVETMKDRGLRHLETHKATLLAVFAERTRGKDCQNDCGYRFPTGNRVTGFDCPNCGADNFEVFARRYLYWQLEYPAGGRSES